MKNCKLITLFTVLVSAIGQPAAAYYSTLTTGQMLKHGHYQLGAETQFVTDGDTGVNLAARFDAPINDELGFRAEAGFGATDFFGGGYIKWVPVPDLESQPAIGVLAGAVYGHYSGIDALSLRAHPFVSKSFGVDYGVITPYAALPFGLQIAEDDTDFTMQIAIGTEYKPEAWEHLGFMAELGFDINDAFPYFSLNATIEWDEENGLVFP